eukprot:scaffold66315_cov48-Phaeocystis_antarctica.AAC.1
MKQCTAVYMQCICSGSAGRLRRGLEPLCVCGQGGFPCRRRCMGCELSFPWSGIWTRLPTCGSKEGGEMVHTPGQRAGWAELCVRACVCVEGWANGSHGRGPPGGKKVGPGEGGGAPFNHDGCRPSPGVCSVWTSQGVITRGRLDGPGVRTPEAAGRSRAHGRGARRRCRSARRCSPTRPAWVRLRVGFRVRAGPGPGSGSGSGPGPAPGSGNQD